MEQDGTATEKLKTADVVVVMRFSVVARLGGKGRFVLRFGNVPLRIGEKIGSFGRALLFGKDFIRRSRKIAESQSKAETAVPLAVRRNIRARRLLNVGVLLSVEREL